VVDGAGTWAIVTASPRTDAAALRSLGLEPIVLDALVDATVRAAISVPVAPAIAPRVVIGDADAWMANWALVGAMREDATVIVHGGPREYRVLVRDATLPPLLDDPIAQCWVLTPGAAPRRSPWPPGANN
jgi:S-DNA-T family DNA segregation ATPase FtsK/SpoIIIE